MVFIRNSPDYCEADEAMNILGTRNRICNETLLNYLPGSCGMLCCGRGYHSQQAEEVELLCKPVLDPATLKFMGITCRKVIKLKSVTVCS